MKSFENQQIFQTVSSMNTILKSKIKIFRKSNYSIFQHN
eukprot:UN14156